MKILHMNSYYVSRELYRNMYDYQDQHGNEIAVFVPVRKGRIPGKFDRGEYTKLSFDFYKIDRYLFHVKHFKILKDIINTYDIKAFNVIHAHSLFSNGYIAYLLHKKYGIPYVVAVRNTDVNDFFKKVFFLRPLGNDILLNADKIVFLSEAYKESVISKYVNEKYKETIKNKSVVIPNGIDDYWYENVNYNVHKKVDAKSINIISVGTIDKNKNYSTSKKVIEELAKKGYSPHWTVVGKKIDESVLLDVKNCTFAEYHEPMRKEELILKYRENDIFLLPSISETFGLTYAESLTQGIPIIYTRGQGFDKQFSDGVVGYPVNALDVSEICEVVEKIISEYDRLSQNAIEQCDRFKWESINKRYIDLYNEVIK